MADEQQRSIELDELDFQIIEALRSGGRETNRALGDRLGVAKTTIASRIRRMSDAGVMRVLGVTDMEAYGFDYFLVIGIRVAGREISEVATELAAISEVTGVSVVLGRFDLMITLMARGRDQIRELLEQRIGSVKGIVDIEAQLTLDIALFRADWGKF